MANRKEYEMLFQLNAQLGGSYNSTFNRAQSAVASMQKEIQALGKIQTDISSYQKQQSAVEATKKKLELLQQQYDNIQKEIKETEGYSSSLENKLLSKQQQIDRTTASLEGQTQKLNQMGVALQEAGVNTDNLTGESARLGSQIEDLKAKQEEAASGAKGFGSAGVEAFGAIQQAIAAAGVAKALVEIKDAYMECVSIAGDFEEGMSTVEALSGATAEEMAALKAEAKELGATTKFTALEAADAMGYMAMAGWDAADMISGMDGVLQLAAASGENLAMVSDIVTDNLTAFGLKASDTARFADVLAAAATNSNTNVSTMGETFKMSASIAGALGYSIEDVATAVGLMANSGVKGSIAGTALKNTFNGLLEGVTLTGAAFGEYNYTAIKADGTMKGFRDTIDELRVYFEQMTEAERVNNAMALAGQRGYNGLLAILNATDEDYASLAASIDNCTGAAQRMATVKLDNMNGQLTLMNSAWDALKTTVGEQFTPVMREVYSVGTEVFQGLNEFVQKHPALVKAIAAFVAVIGLAVGGLAAFAAITKVVIPLMGLLTASIPGVNVVMGVAAAIAAVTAAVVGFVSAANEGVPSVKELTVAAHEMQDTISDAKAVYEETAASTQAAANVADNYISKLEEMGEYTKLADEEKQKYHNTLALLCQTVPELAGLIDLENNTIEGGTAALRANTEEWRKNAMAQAYQDQLTAMYAAQAEVMIEAEQNSIKLTKAQYELEEATKSKGEIQARMNELYAEAVTKYNNLSGAERFLMTESMLLTDEYYDLQMQLYATNKEIGVAERSIKNYEQAMEEDAIAVADAAEQVELAQQAVENLIGTTEEAVEVEAEITQQTDALNDIIGNTTEQVNTLAEAYSEAYDSAYQSISGQYDLWDTADKVVATSVGNINKNLQGQISYWEDYNKNLEALQGRTDDIEGLREVIASFADGSSASVNAVAGMAKASDKELAAMVENYQKLQKAQEETAQSIADLKTEFSDQMDQLTADLEEDIKAMDFGAEAAASARATIQGFISGANSMTQQVQTAYAQLGQVAYNALAPAPSAGNAGSGNSNFSSRFFADTMNFYASGTRAAKEGAAIVGEYGPELVYMNGGETVLNARQTAAVMAYGGRGSGGSTTITLSPSYTISGSANAEEIEAVLRAHDEGLRDMVLEVIDEAREDSARRDYD